MLESLFATKAKENQLSGLKQFQENGEAVCQKSDKRETPITPLDTKREIAKVAGVSHDNIAKVLSS